MAYHKGSFLRGVAVGWMLSRYRRPRFVMHPASFLRGLFAGQALRTGIGGGRASVSSGGAPYHRESFLSGLAAGLMTAGSLSRAGRIPLRHGSFLQGFLAGQRLRLWDMGGAVPPPEERLPGGGGDYEKKSFLAGLAAGRACRGIPAHEDTDGSGGSHEDTDGSGGSRLGGSLLERWMLGADGSGGGRVSL